MTVNIPFPDSDRTLLSISFADTIITNIKYISSEENNHASKIRLNLKSSFETEIRQQFEQYFSLAEFQFSLAYQFIIGTEFQQKVWCSLLEIPIGQVMTYGQLAAKLNSSPRAVGNACRHNPLAVIIPCHRVVSASGIGGYAGDTLALQKTDIDFLTIKKWLLLHEKADI